MMTSLDTAIIDVETDPSLICKYRMRSMLMVLGLFPPVPTCNGDDDLESVWGICLDALG